MNVRNRDLKVTNLLGLSMSKQFRPSTSNIVGVDLTKYKVADRNVFAFDTMSVIRVHKVPKAINDTNDPIIVKATGLLANSVINKTCKTLKTFFTFDFSVFRTRIARINADLFKTKTIKTIGLEPQPLAIKL